MDTYSDIRSMVRDELHRPEFREIVRDELHWHEFRKEGERFRRRMNLMVVAIWVLGLAVPAVTLWCGL